MPCRQPDRLGGRVPYDTAVGRERPGDDAASVWKIEKFRAGPFFSALPEKRFQPRFLSHMRKKAPLTVERKNSKGGFASEQTPHPSSCPPLAADRHRPFRCSSFSHTNRFAGFAWEPCPFANPLKTTKKGAVAPFLGFSPGLGLCGSIF